MKSILGILIAIVLAGQFANVTYSQQNVAGGLCERLKMYGDAKTDRERAAGYNGLRSASVDTPKDLACLRKSLLQKQADEVLSGGVRDLVFKINKPKDLEQLIDVVERGLPLLRKSAGKELSEADAAVLENQQMIIVRVIQRLGELKVGKAIPILRQCLEFEGTEPEASTALALFGDTTSSYPAMEKMVRDLEDQTLQAKWPELAQQMIRIHDKRAKPYLLKLTQHEDFYVGNYAARAFVNLVEEGDFVALKGMTRNPNPSVRSCSIRGIGKIQSSAYDDILVEMLREDADENVRAEAADELGRKNVRKAIPDLKNALKSKDLRIRANAFVALYLLTGTKFDFEGRSARDDDRAEQEVRLRLRMGSK
ncbi:MAG: HEAT repeat domain-containing protein [Elusimicrobiota bacterium]|jgi:HEAT repeat protein